MNQSLPSLIPSIKRGESRANDPHAITSSAAYANARMTVIQSDEYTCRYCGFTSIPFKEERGKFGQKPKVSAATSYEASGFLEVHHIDNNHANNKIDNLITVCPFCHQVFHIGFALSADSAKLIYLPEMSQAALNGFCHAISGAMAMGDEAQMSLASRHYQQLLTYQKRLEIYLNAPLNVEAFSSILVEMQDMLTNESLLSILDPIRVIPNFDADFHKKHRDYWNANVW